MNALSPEFEEFGPGNYNKGPDSSYNVLKKFGDRGFMYPPNLNSGGGFYYLDQDGQLHCGALICA
jgi:hypothetical protein